MGINSQDMSHEGLWNGITGKARSIFAPIFCILFMLTDVKRISPIELKFHTPAPGIH